MLYSFISYKTKKLLINQNLNFLHNKSDIIKPIGQKQCSVTRDNNYSMIIKPFTKTVKSVG